MPAPPTTCNAPVVVEDDCVELVKEIDPVAVTLIAVKLLTPEILPPVPAVVIVPPTFKFPPMPTPPNTCNAPVLVDVEASETLTTKALPMVPPLNALAVLTAQEPIYSPPVAVTTPPTTSPPPTPTPPVTINAPVCVEFVALLLVIVSVPNWSVVWID